MSTDALQSAGGAATGPDSVSAGKPTASFRDYSEVAAGGPDKASIDGVRQHYRLMRENQTVAFVDRLEKKHLAFDHERMTVAEAFERLKGYGALQLPTGAATLDVPQYCPSHRFP
jgi:hypothetical protein